MTNLCATCIHNDPDHASLHCQTRRTLSTIEKVKQIEVAVTTCPVYSEKQS